MLLRIWLQSGRKSRMTFGRGLLPSVTVPVPEYSSLSRHRSGHPALTKRHLFAVQPTSTAGTFFRSTRELPCGFAAILFTMRLQVVPALHRPHWVPLRLPSQTWTAISNGCSTMGMKATRLVLIPYRWVVNVG